MALKGTIRDFGVADIFQLISQQAKTGVLVLKNDVDEVRVFFKEGSVIRADSSTRPGQMLLGGLMVRAEVLTQPQLDEALKEQRRTLQPLGKVLVDLGHARHEVVKEFASLQMTETVYSLFQWKNGTYEFEGVPVEPSAESVEPLRAENVVMNGIRIVDEWPSIREKLPSYTWLVERVKDLPPPKRGESTSGEFELSFEDVSAKHEIEDIGTYERLIFDLIAPGRDVQKLIDLARLGEFEACRAIGNLMSAGYVRVLKPMEVAVPTVIEKPEKVRPKIRIGRIFGTLARVFASATLVIIGANLVARISPAQLGFDPGANLVFESNAVEHHLSVSQMRVIRRALEVYRYETGVYPPALDTLVDAGMLSTRDIRFPFARRYFYAVQEGRVVLLPPVH